MYGMKKPMENPNIRYIYFQTASRMWDLFADCQDFLIEKDGLQSRIKNASTI